jgi:hypothetical protein
MDVREGEVHKPEEVAAPPVTGVRKRKSVVREYAEAIAIAILLALVIRTLMTRCWWGTTSSSTSSSTGRSCR